MNQHEAPLAELKEKRSKGTPVIFVNCLFESDISDRKAFLKTFVKRVEINGNSATVRYELPMGPGANGKDDAWVLSIDTFGGAGVSIGGTHALSFYLL
jgi:site-specific DNA recombinase